nr:hypothetical protein [uncultured Pseudoxanthomonas sp.]
MPRAVRPFLSTFASLLLAGLVSSAGMVLAAVPSLTDHSARIASSQGPAKADPTLTAADRHGLHAAVPATAEQEPATGHAPVAACAPAGAARERATPATEDPRARHHAYPGRGPPR